MTSGELKFALRVEGALNTIPEPEFRQLLVEALMVVSLIVEHNIVNNFGGIINVADIVRTANQIFLQDQVEAHLICLIMPFSLILSFFSFR
jgi:phosphorylase kinase alpha/beta subunit